jgi:hypothetical protein
MFTRTALLGNSNGTIERAEHGKGVAVLDHAGGVEGQRLGPLWASPLDRKARRLLMSAPAAARARPVPEPLPAETR